MNKAMDYSTSKTYEIGYKDGLLRAIEIVDGRSIDLEDPKNTVARIRAENTTAEISVETHNETIKLLLSALEKEAKPDLSLTTE